jgi:nitrogen fixation protein NifU and related proteins
MNSQLRELYQEVIIEHASHPRHFAVIEKPSCTGRGKNPLCGDTIALYINLDKNKITDICFQGQGCAISMASASLMCDALQNKTQMEAEHLFQLFHTLLTSEGTADPELGKLAVLSGVREFPARVKCATLAWHTLQNALNNNANLATTE